jgi:hypothetical protein
MFHLQSIILSEQVILAKNLRQQKAVTFLNSLAFLTLCHTLQSCTRSTPSHYNEGWNLLCICVQFQHSGLHWFGSNVNLQNLVKITGVPWLFLSSVGVKTVKLSLLFQTKSMAFSVLKTESVCQNKHHYFCPDVHPTTTQHWNWSACDDVQQTSFNPYGLLEQVSVLWRWKRYKLRVAN